MQCPMSGPGPCGHHAHDELPRGQTPGCAPPPPASGVTHAPRVPANHRSSDHIGDIINFLSREISGLLLSVIHSIGRIMPVTDRGFLEMLKLFY